MQVLERVLAGPPETVAEVRDITLPRPQAGLGREYGQGYRLTLDDMRWFRSHYLSSELRSEAEAYADRLRTAGVSARVSRYDGLIHGFIDCGRYIDRARGAIEEIADAVRASFSIARARAMTEASGGARYGARSM